MQEKENRTLLSQEELSSFAQMFSLPSQEYSEQIVID